MPMTFCVLLKLFPAPEIIVQSVGNTCHLGKYESFLKDVVLLEVVTLGFGDFFCVFVWIFVCLGFLWLLGFCFGVF